MKLCNATSLEINYNETQFLNGSFQNLLRSYEVWHIAVAAGDHNRQATVERFNRTLEVFIGWYHESRETNRYIDDSDALVFNYNTTFQTNPSGATIKMKHLHENIRIGNCISITNGTKTFQIGCEPSISKAIT